MLALQDLHSNHTMMRFVDIIREQVQCSAHCIGIYKTAASNSTKNKAKDEAKSADLTLGRTLRNAK